MKLTFKNKILTKAVFAHQDLTSPFDRMMDLFKSISKEEALEFELNYGKASNTKYFSGKAIYKIYDSHFFTIIPIY